MRNQEGSAPNTVVRDITFSNNIVRHVGNGIAMHGYDNLATALQTRDIRIVNNVFEELGGDLGAGRFLVMGNEPANITVDHNTINSVGTLLMVSGRPVVGFRWTNNFARHNTYGIMGSDTAAGFGTLNEYFPGYVVAGNVLAAGKASAYPANNYFPTVLEFIASFINAAAGNYGLVPGSPFHNKGTDGKDIGIDTAAMATAQAAQVTVEDTSEPPVIIPPDEEPTEPPVIPPAGTLPSGWESDDIGAVGDAGSASAASGLFTVKGAGADIWDAADEFHFAYRTLSGDGAIVARVASLTGVHAWTKAGVMIRANTTAGSAHGLMLVSVGAFQRRKTNGGVSTSTAGPAGVAPGWVKLTRAGQVISAYSSTNGSTWTLVATETIAMPEDVLVGLAVNGHDVVATATFDNVEVTSGIALPDGWESGDVGTVGKAGNASHTAGTFTVQGAGADIWDNADGLHFVSRTLDGDGEIVARVAGISGLEAWTKVGVMMRQTRDAGSAQAMMLVSVSKGLAFQRRTVTGGMSTNTSGGAGTAPKWVKLTRSGQNITAAVSANGTAWTVVDTDTFSMVGPIEVGLAVSSQDVTRLATGTFDNVTVQ